MRKFLFSMGLLAVTGVAVANGSYCFGTIPASAMLHNITLYQNENKPDIGAVKADIPRGIDIYVENTRVTLQNLNEMLKQYPAIGILNQGIFANALKSISQMGLNHHYFLSLNPYHTFKIFYKPRQNQIQVIFSVELEHISCRSLENPRLEEKYIALPAHPTDLGEIAFTLLITLGNRGQPLPNGIYQVQSEQLAYASPSFVIAR